MPSRYQKIAVPGLDGGVRRDLHPSRLELPFMARLENAYARNGQIHKRRGYSAFAFVDTNTNPGLVGPHCLIESAVRQGTVVTTAGSVGVNGIGTAWTTGTHVPRKGDWFKSFYTKLAATADWTNAATGTVTFGSAPALSAGDWIRRDADTAASWMQIASVVGTTVTLASGYIVQGGGALGAGQACTASGNSDWTEIVSVVSATRLTLKIAYGFTSAADYVILRGTRVNHIVDFTKQNGTRTLVLFGGKDVYKFDASQNRVQTGKPATPSDVSGYLTPKFTTGTATFTTLSTAVTAITFTSADIRVGDFIKANLHSDLCWTPVSSVTPGSPGSLVLERPYPGPTLAGAAFTVRKGLGGSVPAELVTNLWSTSHFANTDSLMIVNNADAPLVWDGSTSEIQPIDAPSGGLARLETVSGTVIARARWVVSFGGRVLFFGPLEGPNDYPFRVRWTPASWNGATALADLDFNDIADTPEAITGVGLCRRFVAVFKQSSIYTIELDEAPFTFFFDRRIDGIGCLAPGTIASLGDEILFLGQDNVYRFNGLQIVPVGNPLKTGSLGSLGLLDLDYARLRLARGYLQREQDTYVLSVPQSGQSGGAENNICWRYNYVENQWSGPHTDSFNSYGAYVQQTASTIDSLTGPIDSYSASIDSFTSDPSAPSSLAGTAPGGGSLYRVWVGDSDRVAPISVTIQTPMISFGTTEIKRLRSIRLHMDSFASGTINLQVATTNRADPNEIESQLLLGSSYVFSNPIEYDSGQSILAVPIDKAAIYFVFKITQNAAGMPFAVSMVDADVLVRRSVR